MKIKSLIENTVLTVMCLIVIIPNLVYTFPFLIGADSSYTIMSGSMNPTLKPGDLIIIRETEPSAINIGNVVTVSDGFTYTHRVVGKLNGDRFRLKGDANEEPDINLVKTSQIIGKVILVFPFSHLYTPYGFAASLIIPAILIIGKQMYNVYQFTKRRNKRETMKWRRKRPSVLSTSTLLLALILTVSTTRIIAPHFIEGSSSYFSDIEWTTGLFRAGKWHVDALVDIDPDVLNLKSQCQWITVYIETGDDEKDIVVNTVKLDGVIKAECGEVQEDGRFMVKFNRSSVIVHLEGCKDGEEVTLTISGKFRNDVKFTGKDTIKVIHDEN